MIIKILGTGCAKCKKLEANALEASQGMDAEVQKVTDINEIMNYGVMMTPALVIDDEVKSTGKIWTVHELERLFGKK